MKNTFLIKMIISCSIGLAIFSTSYAEPKLRDNWVVFFYEDTTQPEADINNTKFTLESYSVTPDQPWGGVISIRGNHLIIDAGRKGSSINNEFLRSHGYNVKANGSGKNVNFAVIGKLSFLITSPHATSTYTCPNIALQQAHHRDVVFRTNEWSFYSNQMARFQQPANYRGPTTITCQNTQTHTMNDFKVRQYTSNVFIISPAID